MPGCRGLMPRVRTHVQCYWPELQVRHPSLQVKTTAAKACPGARTCCANSSWKEICSDLRARWLSGMNGPHNRSVSGCTALQRSRTACMAWKVKAPVGTKGPAAMTILQGPLGRSTEPDEGEGAVLGNVSTTSWAVMQFPVGLRPLIPTIWPGNNENFVSRLQSSFTRAPSLSARDPSISSVATLEVAASVLWQTRPATATFSVELVFVAVRSHPQERRWASIVLILRSRCTAAAGRKLERVRKGTGSCGQ